MLVEKPKKGPNGETVYRFVQVLCDLSDKAIFEPQTIINPKQVLESQQKPWNFAFFSFLQ